MLKILFSSLFFIFLNPLFADTIIKTSSSNSWDVTADIIPNLTGNFNLCSIVTGTGSRIFGASTSLGNASYTSVGWGLYLIDNNLYVYESGTKKTNSFVIGANDLVCVSLVTDTFKYYLNNNLIYTSTKKSTPNFTLLVDLGIYTPDSRLKDISINDNLVSFSNVVNAQIYTPDTDLDEYQLNFLYGLSGLICATFLLFRIS